MVSLDLCSVSQKGLYSIMFFIIRKKIMKQAVNPGTLACNIRYDIIVYLTIVMKMTIIINVYST